LCPIRFSLSWCYDKLKFVGHSPETDPLTIPVFRLHSSVFCLGLVYFQQNQAAHRHPRALPRRDLCIYHRSYSPLAFQEPEFVSHQRNSAGVFIYLLPPGSDPASTHNYLLFAEHARQPRPLCSPGDSAAARQRSIPEVEARAAVCAAAVSRSGVDSIPVAVFWKSASRRHR